MMGTYHGLRLVFLLSVIALARAQENAQTRIPESLMECYQDPILIQKDYELPMTMDMLIDLVRKAENNNDGRNMDMRNLVISLIHRFRLDGIGKANIAASANVVPFSPRGFQFNKHKILLTSLIPGSASQFPNSSLTAVERCSLHHMMSSSIAKQIRGDEGSVCNKLSQYRTQRLPRAIRQVSDVEVMDPLLVDKMNTKGQLRMAADNLDDDVSSDVAAGVFAKGMDTPKSQCPVEDGVVQTQWGAVSVGPLLAGIAAGLNPQKVTIKELVDTKTGDLSDISTITVDNKFAATLAGDLAELALRQGPVVVSGSFNVGSAGGWNSTQAPKWYFLNQASNHEMTDAEIRGGLDGLILATNIQTFVSKASSMKLSQLLEMYYSQRGVFTEKYRACNRKSLMTDVAPTETLLNQVLGFSYVLDKTMPLQVTLKSDGFREYSTTAVSSLNGYIPSNLNDLSCSASATLEKNNKIDIATDIYVVLDTTWQYINIYPSLTYLIEGLNVSPAGSNITLISAKEGKVIVNSTNSPATFQQLYNESIHLSIPMGLDIPKVLMTVKDLQKENLQNETITATAGGKSSLVLFIAGPAQVSDADINFSIEQLRVIQDETPDVSFLYLVSGSKERFNLLVKDSAKDIFTLSTGIENTASQINDVLNRMKNGARRLTNHRCGSAWKATTVGNSVHNGFVTPGSINFYRLLPNYFFNLGGAAALKLQGLGYGPLTVCYSRSVENPRANTTTGNEGITCVPVTSNTVEISLANACTDINYIHKCAPLYISVEAVTTEDTSQNARCTERDCRYPDSVKFTVNLQELGCFSGANSIVISMSLLVVSVSIMFKSLFF